MSMLFFVLKFVLTNEIVKKNIMNKQLYKPNSNDPRRAIESMASANASAIERELKNQHARQATYSIDDMSETMGSKQTDSYGGVMVKMIYHNKTAHTKRLFLGTPLGDSSEAVLIPQIWGTIADANKWTADLASQEDQQGINLTAWQLLNKRLLRNAAVVTSFEIITSSDAQREIPPMKVFTPWNNEEARVKTISYNAIYTEVTGQQLLTKEPVIAGDFSGLALDVLAGVKISCNIYFAATDCNTFKM